MGHAKKATRGHYSKFPHYRRGCLMHEIGLGELGGESHFESNQARTRNGRIIKGHPAIIAIARCRPPKQQKKSSSKFRIERARLVRPFLSAALAPELALQSAVTAQFSPLHMVPSPNSYSLPASRECRPSSQTLISEREMISFRFHSSITLQSTAIIRCLLCAQGCEITSYSIQFREIAIAHCGSA